ncbi:LytR C-terminal domain-containing protein [Nocardia sp. NBC_01329]|uniref:LytR C-terminal domain-containing protein n=1 Tax=Nocardia sp. NBC_01329 TaxID=2903594 RepID=UPI002E150A0F|nr:LytR C-terminal domain-containing protein [Nocardia sp. NBC_01329]
MSNSNPGSGGPPLRATAMVLIALAIVFAGLGAMSLSSADSESSDNAEGAPTTTSSTTALAAPRATTGAAVAPTTAAAGSTTATVPTTTAAAGGADRSAPIRILNNSMVAGLASTTASDLTARGWTNTSTGNYASTTLAATTVYYGSAPGDEATAAAVASDIGATTAPMIPGLGDGSGVVVVVTGR